MLWYITFIAVLNLGLGYLWAAYVRPCPRCAKIREWDCRCLLTLTRPANSKSAAKAEALPIPNSVEAESMVNGDGFTLTRRLNCLWNWPNRRCQSIRPPAW